MYQTGLPSNTATPFISVRTNRATVFFCSYIRQQTATNKAIAAQMTKR